MSKGSGRRPMQCPQEQYDRNWLHLYGVECPVCKGKGEIPYSEFTDGEGSYKCELCNGYGKVEERIAERYKNESS
ncbi:hypothetical protein LCGC14_0476000 [marine sediment metagenome]|uniref:DNA primase/helicase Gp4 N-terminal Bacteriophage T7-like domain-containing protein n=1 Tax=marine sediment metagenome TaxID=412755 RepID=A0A0F9VJJ5_9ZZZZ